MKATAFSGFRVGGRPDSTGRESSRWMIEEEFLMRIYHESIHRNHIIDCCQNPPDEREDPTVVNQVPTTGAKDSALHYAFQRNPGTGVEVESCEQGVNVGVRAVFTG